MNDNIRKKIMLIREDFRTEALPAIRHPSGKVYKGKRKDDHNEVRQKYMSDDGTPLQGEPGYWYRGEFHSRDGVDSRQMLTPKERSEKEIATGFGTGDPFADAELRVQERAKKKEKIGDTTDRMTDTQRMLKYGTFEESTNLERYLRKGFREHLLSIKENEEK